MHADFYLYFIGFLILGMFAGTLSGLMGAGGGLITVPGLAFLLGLDGINPALVMHVAVGTTLAKMVFVASRALFAHLKRNIRFFYVYKRMAPALMIGVIAGGVTAHFLHSSVLKILFGVFVLYLAFGLLYNHNKVSTRSLPGSFGMLSAGAFVGLQSGLFGIGGSAFTVPFLTNRGVSIRTAVVVSVAFATTVAIIGACTFMIRRQENQPST